MNFDVTFPLIVSNSNIQLLAIASTLFVTCGGGVILYSIKLQVHMYVYNAIRHLSKYNHTMPFYTFDLVM